MTDILYVPEGTGPYSVEGQSYNVTDGKISVDNPAHIPALVSLGASPVPFEEIPVFGERVKSEFGPTQEEHDILRARYDELVKENEEIISVSDAMKSQIDGLASTILDLGLSIEDEGACECASRHLRAMSVPASDGPASGDTSETHDDVSKAFDPGFTEDTPRDDMVEWLAAHGAAVPGNISKDNALKAVRELVAANTKGE